MVLWKPFHNHYGFLGGGEHTYRDAHPQQPANTTDLQDLQIST